MSVTFVSPLEGWLLGTVRCGATACAAIVHTLDGGSTWRPVTPPPVMVSDYPTGDAGISSIRFADPRDGWVFGPDLWATHDGGATWHPVTLPGQLPGWPVFALEAANGRAHAVFGPGLRVATTPVGRDAWTTDPLVLEIGGGPVPEAHIVLRGSQGWIVVGDRIVSDGARLVGGAWQRWQPPCLDAGGPATLAAASAEVLVAACAAGLWGGDMMDRPGLYLYRSVGSGAFAEVSLVSEHATETEIAAASPSTILVGGVASFDGGRTWRRVFDAPSTHDLGFTTDQQGVVVAGGRLLMTRDGGHTWSPVEIAAA